jgi:hypothetical protein
MALSASVVITEPQPWPLHPPLPHCIVLVFVTPIACPTQLQLLGQYLAKWPTGQTFVSWIWRPGSPRRSCDGSEFPLLCRSWLLTVTSQGRERASEQALVLPLLVRTTVFSRCHLNLISSQRPHPKCHPLGVGTLAHKFWGNSILSIVLPWVTRQVFHFSVPAQLKESGDGSDTASPHHGKDGMKPSMQITKVTN